MFFGKTQQTPSCHSCEGRNPLRKHHMSFPQSLSPEGVGWESNHRGCPIIPMNRDGNDATLCTVQTASNFNKAHKEPRRGSIIVEMGRSILKILVEDSWSFICILYEDMSCL